uniref:Uncharacterized protein n=1 Tax=Siphoviridae sp. ctHip2 TaxID=2827830 RepID=A0A8S5RVB7_9CAUD|nr:MAG TPA: hypothetical protein [Siphoviridae sp. ctHip2]
MVSFFLIYPFSKSIQILSPFREILLYCGYLY